MITVTEQDIGRQVVYCPRHGALEVGVITSFNERFVFVRYGDETTSQPTSRQDLEWR
jgi:hypothetical protein